MTAHYRASLIPDPIPWLTRPDPLPCARCGKKPKWRILQDVYTGEAVYAWFECRRWFGLAICRKGHQVMRYQRSAGEFIAEVYEEWNRAQIKARAAK